MHKEYQAYLVRCQRGEGQPNYRVRLENAVTGEIIHFATAHELLSYLTQMLAIGPELKVMPNFEENK